MTSTTNAPVTRASNKKRQASTARLHRSATFTSSRKRPISRLDLHFSPVLATPRHDGHLLIHDDENALLEFPSSSSILASESTSHLAHHCTSTSSASLPGGFLLSSSLFQRKDSHNSSSSGRRTLAVNSNSTCSVDSFYSRPTTSWESGTREREFSGSPLRKRQQLLSSPSKASNNNEVPRMSTFSSSSVCNTPLSSLSLFNQLSLEETQTEPFPISFSNCVYNESGYRLKKAFSCSMDKENSVLPLPQSPLSIQIPPTVSDKNDKGSALRRRSSSKQTSRVTGRVPSLTIKTTASSPGQVMDKGITATSVLSMSRPGLQRSFSTSVTLTNNQYIDDCIQVRDDLHLVGDNQTVHSLPICRHSDVMFVSLKTVAGLLTQQSFNGKRFLLLDCRYPYEYSGGHIRSAMNVSTQVDLNFALQHLRGETTTEGRSDVVLIFHCEFSTYRAPSAARRLRAEDRKCNTSRYPFLYFPEIYVMDGGYAEFYEQYPDLCEPRGYVTMRDARFRQELTRITNLSKKQNNLAGGFLNSAAGIGSGCSIGDVPVGIRKRLLSTTHEEEDSDKENL